MGVGWLDILNKIITPFIGVISPQLSIYFRPFIGGEFTPCITTGSGPGPTEKCGLNKYVWSFSPLNIYYIIMRLVFPPINWMVDISAYISRYFRLATKKKAVLSMKSRFFLVMVYYNPYIDGWYNPLYTLNSQVFFSLLRRFHASNSIMPYIESGQIIATSRDLTPKGSLVGEVPLFQVFPGWWIGNLSISQAHQWEGWWIIIICPDWVFWGCKLYFMPEVPRIFLKEPISVQHVLDTQLTYLYMFMMRHTFNYTILHYNTYIT